MKQEYKIFTIKFDDQDYDFVMDRAKEKRLNISSYIRMVVGEYLDVIQSSLNIYPYKNLKNKITGGQNGYECKPSRRR